MSHVPSTVAGRRLAFASVLLAATLFGGQRLEAVPPPKVQVRLMTWNVGTIYPLEVRLPKRFEGKVAQTIIGAQAQVVCLQEVEGLAQVRHIRDLIAGRGGPVYSVLSSASNPSRADGRATGTLYLGRASAAPVWSASTGDQAQALILDDVTIVNVHGPAGEYEHRRTFYPELAKWVKTLPQPVVLAGDFNLGPRGGAGLAAVLPWLRAKDKQIYRDLINGFAAHTELDATTVYGLIFDHVMLSAGRILTQERLRLRRQFPQDHRPVVTELLLPKLASRAAALRGLRGAGRGLRGAVSAAR